MLINRKTKQITLVVCATFFLHSCAWTRNEGLKAGKRVETCAEKPAVHPKTSSFGRYKKMFGTALDGSVETIMNGIDLDKTSATFKSAQALVNLSNSMIDKAAGTVLVKIEKHLMNPKNWSTFLNGPDIDRDQLNDLVTEAASDNLIGTVVNDDCGFKGVRVTGNNGKKYVQFGWDTRQLENLLKDLNGNFEGQELKILMRLAQSGFNPAAFIPEMPVVTVLGDAQLYPGEFGDVIIDALAGTGNAFACVDHRGKLFRSTTACY